MANLSSIFYKKKKLKQQQKTVFHMRIHFLTMEMFLSFGFCLYSDNLLQLAIQRE